MPTSNRIDKKSVIEHQEEPRGCALPLLTQLKRLDSLVEEISALRSKLILLVGWHPGYSKTALMTEFADQRGAKVMNVGAVLGRRLAALPQWQRAIHANAALRELANEYASDDLLLLDNIELLFDHSLKLDPLDLLKRHAHARRVVAVWPGDLCDGRLRYAQIGHPEYRDYSIEDMLTFKIETAE